MKQGIGHLEKLVEVIIISENIVVKYGLELNGE